MATEGGREETTEVFAGRGIWMGVLTLCPLSLCPPVTLSPGHLVSGRLIPSHFVPPVTLSH
jgi:hypothetical protein